MPFCIQSDYNFNVHWQVFQTIIEQMSHSAKLLLFLGTIMKFMDVKQFFRLYSGIHLYQKHVWNKICNAYYVKSDFKFYAPLIFFHSEIFRVLPYSVQ